MSRAAGSIVGWKRGLKVLINLCDGVALWLDVHSGDTTS